MRSRWTPSLIVGLTALVTLVVAGLLPWRSDEVSGADSLWEVARRGPAVLVLYVVALLCSAAALVVCMARPRARLGPLALSAAAVVAALVAMIVLPLPVLRVYGATPDGTFVEFDAAMVRSWGCYLTVSATAICFGARALAAR